MATSVKATHEVFGVSSTVLPDSYVDRGSLDADVLGILERPLHLALRGDSRVGKSWLRQRILPNALVVNCRLGKDVVSIYKEALGQLGIRLEVSRVDSSNLEGSVEASGEVGINLIAKVGQKFGFKYGRGSGVTTEPISQSVDNLKWVAEILRESGRRLVIDDFHYLSPEERKKFAYDLKTLWDLKLYVVVIGIWSKPNLLLRLQRELAGRVEERSILWEENDLRKIFERGGRALNIRFSQSIIERAVADCYNNAGILQKLIINLLDKLGVREGASSILPVEIDDLDAFEEVELEYAEVLNAIYQTFAEDVSHGIRTRQNSTGIYAHALAVVVAADDNALKEGVHIDEIFRISRSREPRIQKGNLRTALGNLDSLQVDDRGHGLVVSYGGDAVTVVDRQLLFYRKYSTVRWPWEDLIADAEQRGENFDSA